MPPVPKKADWPKDSSPVKPNRMSKPRPNKPQIRMRLIVAAEKPRYGRMNGATISAAAVSASTRKGRFFSIGRAGSFAPRGTEKPVGADYQHQHHRREQHDVGVTGIKHRGDTDDLARDEAAEHRARERTNAADDDDDESLHENCLAYVRRDRHHRCVDDAGETRRHGANTEHQHEHLVDIDAQRVDHHRILDPSTDDHAD